jgi:hypothetical protein
VTFLFFNEFPFFNLTLTYMSWWYMMCHCVLHTLWMNDYKF